ncbi:unnamed protein product [Ranitomeya imitator]|uniref:Cytochrome P450 n=1 Tax=Ranitomeya imitator TaxID=111125 RepID=A0ABN9LAB1_9NEOB|nr:unnamed protein product [Ranitomeya imitator]
MFSIDLLTVLVGILFGLFFIKIFRKSKGKSYENFPPGPKPLPIIGNLHILNLKRPYKTFLELSKKYGPVFSVQIGSEKMVILCGYETVKDALVNYAEEFSDRPYIPIFQDLTRGYAAVESAQQGRRSQRLAQSDSVRRVTAAFPASAIEASAGQRRVDVSGSKSCFSLSEHAQGRISRWRSREIKGFAYITCNNKMVKLRTRALLGLRV